MRNRAEKKPPVGGATGSSLIQNAAVYNVSYLTVVDTFQYFASK